MKKVGGEEQENSSDSMETVGKAVGAPSKSRQLEREFSDNSVSPSKQEQEKNTSIQENYLSGTPPTFILKTAPQ